MQQIVSRKVASQIALETLATDETLEAKNYQTRLEREITLL